MHPDGCCEYTDGGLTLAVRCADGAVQQGLVCFGHEQPGGVGPGELLTDLTWLGGDLPAELWQGAADVERGQDGDLYWSANGQLMVLSRTFEIDDATDCADPAYEAYLCLLRRIASAGYPHLLRLWNFLPDINRGAGDNERYRRFCVGRNLALEALGIADSDMCAGTAVGTPGRRLLIHALAGRVPGTPVENPRQVAAYRYPRIYGPRSPSFARATAVPLACGRQGLLVSGTASIVGHRTIHPGELMPQLDETILNLEALLAEACAKLKRNASTRFDGDSLLRVYLRDASRWSAVERRLRAQWPEARMAGLHADICRSDLMVEIEAFHLL